MVLLPLSFSKGGTDSEASKTSAGHMLLPIKMNKFTGFSTLRTKNAQKNNSKNKELPKYEQITHTIRISYAQLRG